MLPAFATTDQLAARFPGGIASVDAARAQAALDDASAKVRAETNKDWMVPGATSSDPPVIDPALPDIIVIVTLAAALRAFTNPEQLSQEGIGTYHASYANGSMDVYLTSQERRLIRKAAGNTGVWTQPTTRGNVETSMWPWEDIFLPTTLASDPGADADVIKWAGPVGF